MYKWYKERLDTLWAPGLKIWSNGIPLKLDLYQSCQNYCRYCYAKEMRDMTLNRNGIQQNPHVARLIDYKSLIRFVNKAHLGYDTVHPFMNWAIRNKYFIELGTTGETFQEADLEIKITESFLRLFSDLQIPLFINTKGNLICHNEKYQNLLINYKAPILLSWTLTTTDDKLGKFYEPLAPLPSERLRVAKELNKYPHIKSAVYISPFLPGVTNLDTEKFIHDIVDAKMVGGHLRDFYIQGQTFRNQFWQKYVQENQKDIESFPGGYHVKFSTRLAFLEKAQNIAMKKDPCFRIVGMKTKFFDLETHYGKLVYDVLDEPFKKGIVDFTSVPLLRKIREHKEEPQLLVWDKLGYKKDKINIPDFIRSNEGDINNLMDTNCNCNKSEVELRIAGYDWVTHGMWNGFDNRPSGFISTVEGIYPVKHKNEFTERNGNYLYAYLPPKYENLLKSETGQLVLFETKAQDLINPYLEYDIAKEFLTPERKGGTEDKWLKKEEV